MSVLQTSIQDLHQQLVAKEVTAYDLVEQAYKEIEALDSSLHAFISLQPDRAKAQARAIDEEGIQEGDYLRGIPVVLQDNLTIQGEKMTAGSRYLEDYEAIYDSTVYAKLKEAGAIVIGKANMDEFGMGSRSQESYYSASYNPWKGEDPLEGTAVAVASGQAVVGVASDTEGALRQSASLSGLVGMKPSYGLVSRLGLVAQAGSFDTVGVLSQGVLDNAIVLQAIAGEDDGDMTSLPHDSYDFLSDIDAGVQGLTIGVIDGVHEDSRVPAGSQELLSQAIDTLTQAGAQVKTIQLPHAQYSDDAYAILSAGESFTSMHRYDGIRYGYRSQNYTDLESLYVQSRSESFGPEVKARIVEGSYVTSKERIEDYYVKAAQVRRLIKDDFEKAFEEVDVIISPVTFAETDLSKDSQDLIDRLARMVNLAGLPALSLPIGFVDSQPVGMQVMGQPLSEDLLYQVGQAFQSETDFHTQHPNVKGGQ